MICHGLHSRSVKVPVALCSRSFRVRLRRPAIENCSAHRKPMNPNRRLGIGASGLPNVDSSLESIPTVLVKYSS